MTNSPIDDDFAVQRIIDEYCELEERQLQLDEQMGALVGNNWHRSVDPRAVLARARNDELNRERLARKEQVIDTPARSARDVALKLRFMLCLIEGCVWNEFYDRLLRSAVADASRLWGRCDSFKLPRLMQLAPALTQGERNWTNTSLC